jgi:hypothetical protein
MHGTTKQKLKWGEKFCRFERRAARALTIFLAVSVEVDEHRPAPAAARGGLPQHLASHRRIHC